MASALAVGVLALFLAYAPAVAEAGSPAAGTASGSQRSIVIEDFHADIRVRPDGVVLITETLRPRFTGSWNGFFRTLSLRPPESYRARHELDIHVVSVTDQAGRPLRHELSRPRRATLDVQIWVPDAADRAATVVLSYQVRGALGFFEAHPRGEWDAMDELNWQVTGTDWEMPVLGASARITLPPGSQPLQAAAYVGGRRSTATVPLRVGDGTAEVPSTGSLDPGHGLTVAVGWPAGFVDRPAGAVMARPRPLPGPLAFWPLLIPFVVFWWSYRIWSRNGRDPAERSISVQWEPPASLSAVEAGTLVDHGAEMHDIVSILVDLAVRGYLLIEERERTGFLGTSTEYRFHLMKGPESWHELAPFERRFLKGLFVASARPDKVTALGGRSGILRSLLGSMASEPPAATAPDGAIESVRLVDLQNRFYKEIPAIKREVYAALVRKGHYHERPDQVRQRWLLYAGLAFAAGGAAIFAGVALSLRGIADPVAFVLAVSVSPIILAVFGWIMPARTNAGGRAREGALGFKRFLQRVEAPRFRRMISSPDQFERYLPYAIAFRCEEEWAKAFDGLLQEPPSWYRGTGSHATFRPSTFARGVGGMATTVGSTLSSSPSSSSSGGGGSVGGGGGGGGGRGF